MAGIRVRIQWGIAPILVLLILMAVRVGMHVRSGGNGQPTRCKAAWRPRFTLSLSVVLVTLLSVEGVLALAGVPRGEAVFAVRGADGVALHAGGAKREKGLATLGLPLSEARRLRGTDLRKQGVVWLYHGCRT